MAAIAPHFLSLKSSAGSLRRSAKSLQPAQKIAQASQQPTRRRLAFARVAAPEPEPPRSRTVAQTSTPSTSTAAAPLSPSPSPALREPPVEKRLFEHVIEAQQFNRDLLSEIFEVADEMQQILEARGGAGCSNMLRGYLMATLFYEPSTRTRLSFESAMKRLGGEVLTTENAREFSSAAKGESLADSIRTVEAYADVIVLRHYEEGAAKLASQVASVPIVNAGDGPGQHPTQSLLDMYTIQREVGRLDNIRVGLVGDLANGRTARSLAYLLAKFRNNKIIFVAPPVVRMKDDIKEYLTARGVEWEESADLMDVAAQCDVVYQTRIQKERFGGRMDEYEAARGKYIVDRRVMNALGKDAIVMHPLPRLDEITTDVDSDPRDLDISSFANANDFGDAARPNFGNVGLASFHNATVNPFGHPDDVAAHFGNADLAGGDSDGSLVPWDPDVDDVDQTFYPFVIEPRRPPPGVPFDPAGAPRPSNEEFRLQVLRRFAILDTEPNSRFDRITALAAQIFKCPISLVAFVEDDRQWFKSTFGLPGVCETDRESSFCAYMLLPNRNPCLVVKDALEDSRFVHNKLVVGPPYIRFYAGAPVTTSGGFVLGSLCVIDTVPHPEFSPEQESLLVALASLVTLEMDKHSQEIEAQRVQADKFEEDKRGLLLAIDAFSEGLVLVDVSQPRQPVVFVNEGWEEITGYSIEHVVGLHCGSILQGPGSNMTAVETMRKAVETGGSASVELMNYKRDGTPFWNWLRIHPVPPGSSFLPTDKNQRYYFGILSDCTARKENEWQLESMRMAEVEREASMRAKRQFVANISHEIRTPMNAVLACAQLLQDAPNLTQDQVELVHMISGAGQQLLSLITDILDFSKLDAGKMEMHEREVSLWACLDFCMELLVLKSQRKGLDLSYNVDPSVPQWIWADEVRLRQILTNLLSNAAKFTDEGGQVEVSVSATLLPDPEREEGEQQQGEEEPWRVLPWFEIQFSVRDTGIGMPPEFASVIFEAFTQCDNSRTRRYEGTGLGMAIAKDLSERMGGRIWVDTELGMGSTFHFTIHAHGTMLQASNMLPSLLANQASESDKPSHTPFPLPPDSTPTLSPLHTLFLTPPITPLTGKRALLVGVPQTFHRMLGSMLAAWGVSCTAVRTVDAFWDQWTGEEGGLGRAAGCSEKEQQKSLLKVYRSGSWSDLPLFGWADDEGDGESEGGKKRAEGRGDGGERVKGYPRAMSTPRGVFSGRADGAGSSEQERTDDDDDEEGDGDGDGGDGGDGGDDGGNEGEEGVGDGKQEGEEGERGRGEGKERRKRGGEELSFLARVQARQGQRFDVVLVDGPAVTSSRGSGGQGRYGGALASALAAQHEQERALLMMHLGCACAAMVPTFLFLSKHSKRQLPFDPALLRKVAVLSRPVRVNQLYKHLIEYLAPSALASVPAVPDSPRYETPAFFDEPLDLRPAPSAVSPSPAPAGLSGISVPSSFTGCSSAPLASLPASIPTSVSTTGPAAGSDPEEVAKAVARDVAALRVAVVKEPMPLGVVRAERSSPRPGDLQVLIAEDNIVNQRVLLKLLNGIGVRSCYTAINGLEVMQRLRQVTVDLVLMDVQMPEMDGLTATACLRRELPPEQQPVVAALTADVGSGIESESGVMEGSSSREGGIQLLLAAEQEAQKVVAAARAAKTARLRQAKEEAEREAAAYRAQREEEYRKKKAGTSGDSEATVKRLEVQTRQKIDQLTKEAGNVSKDVTAMLLDLVTTVKH
ncbi:unnamed protein product [Closterium sp. Yama58-4]|nr:unnamed protein product [Closterium sp. Yama58-4]